jgi:hypothetical protein
MSATFVCEDRHMRALVVAFALFIYISMDITVNHGATVRGWVAVLSSIVHSLGF